MRIILRVFIIIAVVWGILRLTPAETKKTIAEKAGGFFSFIAPDKAKDKLGSIFLSPIERRAKIISQLEKNIASIEEAFDAEKTSSSMPAKEREAILEVIGKTKDEIAKLNETNKDQGIVNKITSGVFHAVSNALGLAPETPTSSSEIVKEVVCSDK